jgi:hypothetical protein
VIAFGRGDGNIRRARDARSEPCFQYVSTIHQYYFLRFEI